MRITDLTGGAACVVLLIGGIGHFSPAAEQIRLESDVPSNDVVDKFLSRERWTVAQIQKQTPMVQTYLQEVKFGNDERTIPVHDRYFLGLADLSAGVSEDSVLVQPKRPTKDLVVRTYEPSAFLQMMYVDTDVSKLDRDHYDFVFAGREFLGEVRCLKYDARPKLGSGKGRFEGRVWVEDRDYTIVRFSGAYTPIQQKLVTAQSTGHFDSWRANVQPGLWLPFYIYHQELDLKYLLGSHMRFKAETRLWGYKAASARRTSEFTKITIDTDSESQESQTDLTPAQARRAWAEAAESNVLDSLQKSGLLAPTGEVDTVLNKVLNDIEVTNDLDDVYRVRVATVGTFEVFTVGKTIVISRGLIDVIPNEPTLAAVLAEGIAETTIPSRRFEQFAFGDFASVPAQDAFRKYDFRLRNADLKQARERASEMFLRSPYKDDAESVAYFLEELDKNSKSLSALISPKLGNAIDLHDAVNRTASSTHPRGPALMPALAVGGRIRMNPWDDSVTFLKTSHDSTDQLLPGSQTGKRNWNVEVRRSRSVCDQLFRQLQDIQGRLKSRNQNAAHAEVGCAQNQVDRFLEAEEVPRSVGIGHRHRSTHRYLLSE
jgi:hypothetical protein